MTLHDPSTPRPHFGDRLRATLSAAGGLGPARGGIALLTAAGLLALAALLYLGTQHTVTLDLNGTLIRHRTHQRLPLEILREMGVTLAEGDLMAAPSEEELLRGAPIRVVLARLVLLVHDGTVTRTRTQAATLGEALRDSGVTLFSYDHLTLGGKPTSFDTPLPALKPTRATVASVTQAVHQPARLSIQRAVSIRVQDGPVPISFYTTARTVGEALHERGLIIYLGDQVSPGVEVLISPGLTVYLERSKPLLLDVGGERKWLRTRAKTVEGLLETEPVLLGPKDYVLPDPRTAIAREMRVAVVRVHDEYFLEETSIPYEVRWEPDAVMEIDARRTARIGREGAQRRRIRAHYENGRELYRTEEEEWTARLPVDRIINYGTKIILHQLDTSSGGITYWRRIRVLATSYSASTAGTPRSSPYYGLTRLGWPARKGIVAVDPRIISLGTELYVPGYGLGTAADTGSAINARHIDLCFNDWDLEMWYRWVDVYLLSPAPPTGSINWILPDLS